MKMLNQKPVDEQAPAEWSLTYATYQSIMADIETGVMRAVLVSGSDCTELILTKVRQIGAEVYDTVKYEGDPDDRVHRFHVLLYTKLQKMFGELSPEIANQFREFAGKR